VPKHRAVEGYKIIRAVDANMKVEGLSASSKVKDECHAMLIGKTTAEKLIERYISQYKK
jgi:hypothetical protein